MKSTLFGMVALGVALSVSAAETPYDLIRPVFPMVWDTSSVADGGTVLSFSQFVASKNDSLLGVPELGSKPADFKANGYISDSLDQAYIDALNLKVSNIRVNQAGYLLSDPEKLFYYATSGECADVSYSVVDLDGKELAKDGALSSTEASAKYKRIVKASSNAVIDRYTVDIGDSTKFICVGKLADMAGLPNDQRLRIKVGKEYSSTFIISDKVYSMLRDASLKFFGAQRSGDSESWFHGPSHLKDTITGGWYDAGDYVKEGPTMTYAFMMLSALATLHPERDEDHYAFNHNETNTTDGIPDILREARHGAEFFLRSYEYAKGDFEKMAVTVGNINNDHLLWDRPENMDSREDAKPRPLIYGIGPAFSGSIAAGLAFLSQSYAAYDKTFADSCLKVAEKLYAYGKANKDAGENCENEAYSCVQKPEDELAMAAIALHYATYEKTKKMDYMDDLTINKDVYDNSANFKYSAGFAGGWLGIPDGFKSNGWMADYQNNYSIALYAFYKLFLADSSASMKYGLSDSLRVDYLERITKRLVEHVVECAHGESKITLPYDEDAELALSYSTPWYQSIPALEAGVNGYEAGALMALLIYAEVTGNAQVRQLAINKMNAFLGLNRWDISFVMGVGDKNEAHPHSRMANPEGWNGNSGLAPYRYSTPVGALLGGVLNETLSSDWRYYTGIETDLWYNASFLAATVLLAADHPVVSPKDSTKNDSTKTDTTKTDSAKADSSKKDYIPSVSPAGASHLEIANHGNVLDVNYVLPTARNVRVSLVSIKGKTLKLYNPGQQGAGRHALQWNMEQVPAGAYIVKFSAGSIREYKVVRIGL